MEEGIVRITPFRWRNTQRGIIRIKESLFDARVRLHGVKRGITQQCHGSCRVNQGRQGCKIERVECHEIIDPGVEFRPRRRESRTISGDERIEARQHIGDLLVIPCCLVIGNQFKGEIACRRGFLV